MNKQTEWQRLLQRLTALGWTQTQIGKRCKCRQQLISSLNTGRVSEPKAGLGERLRKLDAEASK